HVLDTAQFRLAFNVEAVNSTAERKFDFTLRLADTGENAFLRRTARRQNATQFAFADDVEAAAQLCQSADDGGVGVGLDGEADQVIERRQDLVEPLKMIGQRVL